jgi:hypothetical protein
LFSYHNLQSNDLINSYFCRQRANYIDSSTLLAQAEQRLQQEDTTEKLQMLLVDITRHVRRITARLQSKCTQESEQDLQKNRKALNQVKKRVKAKIKSLGVVEEDGSSGCPEDGETSTIVDEDETDEMGPDKCTVMQNMSSIMNRLSSSDMKMLVDSVSVQIHCTRDKQ